MAEQEEIKCKRCKQSCFGDVVNAYGKYYHQYCFSCVVVGCNKYLTQVGFFLIGDEIYCRDDYRKLLGIKCAGCLKYVEGDAIEAMDSKFHPMCFGCVNCGKVFPVGSEVCYDGEDFFCQNCNVSPPVSPKKPVSTISPQIEDEESVLANSDIPREDDDKVVLLAVIRAPYQEKNLPKCTGCDDVIEDGQELFALETQWHLWCFTCYKCGILLTTEYVGKDGIPYCEKDYQEQFGVCCAGCGGYITGKVLQAAENHYHPHCSRCAKCGEIFGEGEDMYLLGNEIWHPECNDEAEVLQKHGSGYEQGSTRDAEDRETRSDNLSRANTSSPHIEGEPAATTKPSEWKPISQNTNPVPYGESSGFCSGKSPGFHSVKPPVPVASKTTKSPDDEGDQAPPIPPPPTRYSSSQWREKYTADRYMRARRASCEPVRVRAHSYDEIIHSGQLPYRRNSNKYL